MEINDNPVKNRGFTLLELLLSVVIIAILSAVTIPNYLNYRMRVKAAEAKTNIGSIFLLEEGYASEKDEYVVSDWVPTTIPGVSGSSWPTAKAQQRMFYNIGFAPRGTIYYQYGINNGSSWSDTLSDGTTASVDNQIDITIQAQSDLDSNGVSGQFYATDEDRLTKDNNPGSL